MGQMSLKFRLTLRVALVIPLLLVLLIGPAGSLRFWQGWAFVAMFTVFSAIFCAYFYLRDRGLLERRLHTKETRPKQKQFKRVWVFLWTCTLVLPGLDYRFGWSAAAGGVPLWLDWACIAIVAVSWLIVFQVMRFNSFASAVIQVETGQKVISDGPYRLVRHPMYSGFAVMILATPVAMGSYVALAPALLLIPVLVFRLLDEEHALCQELAGYAEYCEQTRFRLMPGVY